MVTAEFRYATGGYRLGEVPNDCPAVLLDTLGVEWVLAQRPGVAENVHRILADGSLEPAPTVAIYQQSTGVDATCLDCGTRDRFASHITADYALKPHRRRGHDTLVIAVHLDDANVIEWLNRTVGDVRESTPLRENSFHHFWNRIYRWAIRINRNRASQEPTET